MKTNKNNTKYIKLFILEQCLQFGYQTDYTNKKLNNYIYITKEKKEIFNLYDLRAMILKLYPLINALFYTHNTNYTIKFRKFQKKKELPILEKKNYKSIEILFASTTPKFKDIIQESASLCNMPFSTGRWLNGSLTAVLTKKTINWRFAKKLDLNSMKLSKDNYLQNFSLIILPDAPNNKMILNEAQKKNIPTLGLLSSSANVDLHYAIFGDYTSTYIVSFFCNLTANLILKENVLSKYRENLNAKIQLHTLYKSNTKKNILRKKTRLSNYFTTKLKNIKFDNNIKRNFYIAQYKQIRLSNIFKKLFYFYANTTKQTTNILKKYFSKLFRRRFLNKNKKKINLFWIYQMWKKNWPSRPWNGLRYHNDVSSYFVAFKYTKWNNFWRNKFFTKRKYIKKFYAFKQILIPARNKRFQKYNLKIKNANTK